IRGVRVRRERRDALGLLRRVRPLLRPHGRRRARPRRGSRRCGRARTSIRDLSRINRDRGSPGVDPLRRVVETVRLPDGVPHRRGACSPLGRGPAGAAVAAAAALSRTIVTPPKKPPRGLSPRPPPARLPLPAKRSKPHGKPPKAYDRRKEKERLRRE